LLLATGHYRNGVLLTPITADVIAKLVVSHELDPISAGFGLDRFRTGGRGGVVPPGANTAPMGERIR